MIMLALVLTAFYGEVLASPLLIDRQSTSTGTGPYAPAVSLLDHHHLLILTSTRYTPKIPPSQTTIPYTTTLPVLL